MSVVTGASCKRRLDPRGTRIGGSKCASSSPSSTLLSKRESGQTMAEYAVVLAVIVDRHPRCARRSLRLHLRRARHGHGRDLDPATVAGFGPRLLLASDRERRRIGASLRFLGGHTPGVPGALPDLPQPARRRGARAHGRRDPGRGGERPACPGSGRDGDRAARAPAARRVLPRALQRAARLHRAARARRRQGRRRLRRQLRARTALRERPADALRPAHGRAAGGDRRGRA